MKRSEFLTTIKGQEHAHFRRKLQVLYLRFDQEPQTKAISKGDAKYFRKSVKKQLKSWNRRAFAGDIVLQINFFSSAKVPQPVQTLVKNYLDLLHKAMPNVDRFEKILFKDDSQVKLLIANHYVNSEKSHIHIQAYRFSHFVKDAEYANNIIEDRFSDKSYSIRSGIEFNNRERDFYPSLVEMINEYKNLGKNGAIQPHPLALFQEDTIKRQIQKKYIEENQIQIGQLLEYLKGFFHHSRSIGGEEKLPNLSKWLRDYMFIALDFIPMGGAPVKEGQKKTFRVHLQNQLKQFVKEHPYLFPLLQPVGLTIIVIPPAYNCPDADNLARQIVPFFDEICRPPLSHTTLSGLPTHRTEKVRISTSAYQIMYLPRDHQDTDDGKIMVLLDTDFLSLTSIWAAVEKVIERWEDHIKYKYY